jgi:methanogenic corrinoid protein MtbC1
MVEIALCEAGWQARSYGCGHPADTLVQAIRDVRPRLFWLSVSSYESEEQFLTDYEGIYEAARELAVAVLIGGRALTPAVKGRIEYSSCCASLREAVAFARALYTPGASPADGRREVG